MSVLKQSTQVKDLDATTRKILDAIIKQQDVFQGSLHTRTTIRTLHGETVAKMADEHRTIRNEIILEIEVRLLFGVSTYCTHFPQLHKKDTDLAEQE